MAMAMAQAHTFPSLWANIQPSVSVSLASVQRQPGVPPGAPPRLASRLNRDYVWPQPNIDRRPEQNPNTKQNPSSHDIHALGLRQILQVAKNNVTPTQK